MRFIRSGLHLRDAAPQLNGQSLTRSREPLLQKWSVNMPCKLNKLTLKGRLVEGANEGFLLKLLASDAGRFGDVTQVDDLNSRPGSGDFLERPALGFRKSVAGRIENIDRTVWRFDHCKKPRKLEAQEQLEREPDDTSQQRL